MPTNIEVRNIIVGGGGGIPATTVVDEITYGLPSAVGTASKYAREDHTHGTPDLPTTAVVTDTLNKRYVTDADLTKLGNTSGVNTGDQDLSGYSPTSHNHTGVYAPVLGLDDNYVTDAEKIILSNTSGSNTGDNAINSLYDGLGASKQDKTEKGQALGYASLDINAKLPAAELTYHNHQVGIEGTPTRTTGSGGTAGMVSVATAEAWFYTDSTKDETIKVTMTGGTFMNPTDDTTTYICADRDTADWVMITDITQIDYIRYVPYFLCYRIAGSTNLHFQIFVLEAHGEIEDNHSRDFRTQRYQREPGALESISVDTSLNLSVSGGGVWSVNHRYERPAVTVASRQFQFVYNGTSWIVSPASHLVPIINNLQYQGPTGYVTLTTGYWTVNHIYRGIEDQDHTYLVLGTSEYANADLAKASTALGSIPGLITAHAMYVGRVIIQKSATTGIICESAFTTVFAASTPVSDHGVLTGLADDDHTQYHTNARGDARYPLKNADITPGTNTKITYDAKGLVTSGTSATTADIADSTNKRYVTDADLTDIGNLSGTNSGDQTSIVGITGTKAQFNTAVTDGDILYVGDITQYTDEQAQDSVGTILVDSSTIDFTYNDATPSITAIVIDKSITLAKQADVATGTVFYRKTAATGSPEVQTLATLKTDLGLTGTNSGDQTSIVGITGTLAEFNAALTGADFTTGGGTATGTNTGDQNLFSTISVAGQSDVVADTISDTLTLVAGTNVTITTTPGTDTITINASGGSLTTQDEGGTLSTAVTTLNFTGGGVTASGAGATTTINIPGGAGSLTKGLAEVDFGVITTQTDIATITVNDAGIGATSYPSVTMHAIATTDHDPDDYFCEGLTAYVANIVNGVSFDIIVSAPNLTWGKYKVSYLF